MPDMDSTIQKLCVHKKEKNVDKTLGVVGARAVCIGVAACGLLGGCAGVAHVLSESNGCQLMAPDAIDPHQPTEKALEQAFSVARNTWLIPYDTNLIGRAKAIPETLNASKLESVRNRKNKSAIRNELEERARWLADYPVFGESATEEQKSASLAQYKPAISAALKVIELVGRKQAQLEAGAKPPPATPTPVSTNPTREKTGAAIYSREDHDSLQDAWQQFAGLRPFHLLTLAVAAEIQDEFGSSPRFDGDGVEMLALVRLFNISNFLATYFDAYFRNGYIADVKISQTVFVENIVYAVKQADNNFDAAELRKLLGGICKGQKDSCFSIGGVGTQGFVSIFGDTTQFGDVRVSFESTAGAGSLRPTVSRPVLRAFGPQLTRVLVEAVADANGPHPTATASATACTAGLFMKKDRADQCMNANEKENQEWRRIDAMGNSTEAIITTGVGALIRGANVGALNNETVATVTETLAGVAARKSVQKAIAACEWSAAKSVAPPKVTVADYSGSGK